jgi:hypothetical protein
MWGSDRKESSDREEKIREGMNAGFGERKRYIQTARKK